MHHSPYDEKHGGVYHRMILSRGLLCTSDETNLKTENLRLMDGEMSTHLTQKKCLHRNGALPPTSSQPSTQTMPPTHISQDVAANKNKCWDPPNGWGVKMDPSNPTNVFWQAPVDKALGRACGFKPIQKYFPKETWKWKHQAGMGMGENPSERQLSGVLSSWKSLVLRFDWLYQMAWRIQLVRISLFLRWIAARTTPSDRTSPEKKKKTRCPFCICHDRTSAVTEPPERNGLMSSLEWWLDACLEVTIYGFQCLEFSMQGYSASAKHPRKKKKKTGTLHHITCYPRPHREECKIHEERPVKQHCEAGQNGINIPRDGYAAASVDMK